MLSETDIAQLRSTVAGTNILIMSDEVYEHLIFDGRQHQSMLRYPDLYERSFVSFSFGKVYNCTGWKLGYCIAPPAFTKEFRKVHQFNCFSCHSPAQVALAQYLQPEEPYLRLSGQLQAKRDYFRQLMQATPFEEVPSFGSYFEMYSYANISHESDTNMAMRLVKECGVATIPASAFYVDGDDHKVLRFCFAKKETTLEAAAERLKKIS
ncbi:aminotransferase class I/II-fold pyridoxal phosphate-dependent enzyme [Phnomibacter ginsenosidimutans]|uniref:aminotransferase class I/II-fold pyridoxal phosphate-dependent enzyme n=1 Tax=Phnomibacter ginsenosidimutans TaxID=2676868 RepID=UPI002483A919|nr:aminotransferase class I/II-fold pyridoxal phosphate-dependent enzyme [Phnomibacter ginsenosidimutans]